MVEDIQRTDTRMVDIKMVDIRTKDMVDTLMTMMTKKTFLSLKTTFRLLTVELDRGLKKFVFPPDVSMFMLRF